MAAVTHRVTTPDTGNTPNTSGVYTPAIGDLCVGFLAATGTVDTGPTFVASAGETFSLQLTVLRGAGADRLYVFVANALTAAATSRSITANTPNDSATGTVIAVYSISGMTRVGASAIRQSGQQDNQAGATTPAPAFSAAVLTGNPTIVAVMNASNPAALNLTSWTEGSDTGYTTPPTGLQSCFRDSGFTGTALTYDGPSATAFGSIAIEFDTSVLAAGHPTMRRWGGIPHMGARKGSSGGGTWG